MRVARRRADGGHFVPDQVVRRRYWAGLRNLTRSYIPLADIAAVYDNTEWPPILVAEKSAADTLTIFDEARWSKILEAER